MAEVLTNSFLTGESMAGLKAGAPTPQALTVHEASRVLEVGFSDGATFRIPFELMRVYSPSAEVQGHGPGQEVLQTGKRDVLLVGLEPVDRVTQMALGTPPQSTGGVHQFALLSQAMG